MESKFLDKALEEAYEMDSVLMRQAVSMRSQDQRHYFSDERPRDLEGGQSLEDRAYAQAVRSQTALDLVDPGYKSHSRESRVQYPE